MCVCAYVVCLKVCLCVYRHSIHTHTARHHRLRTHIHYRDTDTDTGTEQTQRQTCRHIQSVSYALGNTLCKVYLVALTQFDLVLTRRCPFWISSGLPFINRKLANCNWSGKIKVFVSLFSINSPSAQVSSFQ